MNELYTNLFSQLCDFYYHTSTGTEADEFIDTSPESAVKVMEYIQTELIIKETNND